MIKNRKIDRKGTITLAMLFVPPTQPYLVEYETHTSPPNFLKEI